MDDASFRRRILGHWIRDGRRALPWRRTRDPYAILVSEIMLQQTQVERVIPYYRAFLTRFPTFAKLARARQGSVLMAWQGLGYNRRALNLQRCARMVVAEYGGKLPETPAELVALPGIGSYTAGAVLAFAFNRGYPVIETNIRRTYIHHYFPKRRRVSDAEVLKVVERTLDRRNPRRWYAALMDYGAHLATETENPNRRSRHYMRQARFEGSDRQLRGAILRHLLRHGGEHEATLITALDISQVRAARILGALKKEGFVERVRGRVRLVP